MRALCGKRLYILVSVCSAVYSGCLRSSQVPPQGAYGGPWVANGRSWRGSTAQWTAVHAAREMRGLGALDASRGGARAPPESGVHCGSIRARTRVSPPSGKRPGACGTSTSPAVSRKQGDAGHGNRTRGHHSWLHPCPDPCFPPKRPDGKHARSIWGKHAQPGRRRDAEERSLPPELARALCGRRAPPAFRPKRPGACGTVNRAPAISTPVAASVSYEYTCGII